MQHPQTPNATELLDHLRAEEGLIRDALAAQTDLYAALRGGDLPTVEAMTPRQEAAAAALAARQQVRAAAAHRLAAAVGLPAAGLTLTALADRLTGPAASELRAARDQLAPLAAAARETQARNANLMRHLRSYFRAVLAALAGDPAPARYGRTGACLPASGGVAVQTRG